MSGDYSRIVFDPARDYDGVLLQQGRPLLDSDWNDQVAQATRQAQATRFDTFGGAAVVPVSTPDAFKLAASGAQFTIGRGRLYVDGLLAENHCLPTPTWNTTVAWDAALAELIGTQPVPYDQQPYLPDAPALPASAGPHVVYADVWVRELTPLEAPALVDPAVGIDCSTRLQVAWQVKVLENGQGVDLECSTDPDAIPGWDALVAPSAGRLSNGAATYGTVDPCTVPPTGGYTGLENQLYRVEIHQGGAPGKASFKWSRDNASVQTRVSSFVDATTLVVESVGKDGVLRFNDGDWIELLDDRVELNDQVVLGQPGELHRIVQGGGVDDATRTITLETPVTAGRFNADPAANRHTRIRRWDQRGQVLRTDTPSPTVYTDLDAAGSAGDIAVPADASITLALEDGIVVRFDVAAAGGLFKSGDWWTFAARTADAAIEPLVESPPRGIHHHYARLGLWAPNAQPTDCRQFWPTSFGDEACSCTVCVSPQQHAQSAPSLQQAIDTVIAIGGGTVCLEVGDYALAAPLRIEGAHTLGLRGQGQASRLLASQDAIDIVESLDVTLEGFQILGAGTTDTAAVHGISANAVQDLRLRRLEVMIRGSNTASAALALTGQIARASLVESQLLAPVGVQATSFDAAGGPVPVLLQGLRIEGNVFHCASAGVQLALAAQSQGPVQVLRNQIDLCSHAGIELVGTGITDAGVEIAGNRVSASGNGIAVGVPGVRILDNDVTFGGDPASTRVTFGIALLGPVVDGATPGDAHVTGNRVAGFSSTGIQALGALRRLQVKQNQVSRCGAGIDVAGTLEEVAIENNQLADIDLHARDANATRLVGIGVAGAAGVALAGNAVARFGLSAVSPNLLAAALWVLNCDGVRIAGNELSEIGPSAVFAGAVVGVLAQAPLADILVEGNRIRRDSATLAADASGWIGIFIGGAAVQSVGIANATGALASDTLSQHLQRLAPVNAVAMTKTNTTTRAGTAATAAAAAAAGSPALRASVRGNQVGARGGSYAIAFVGVVNGDLSDNQCIRISGANLGPATPDVILGAQALVVGGNRVSGPQGTSMLLSVPEGRFTVLGNITSGAILALGAPLAAPWAALNVLAP